MAVSAWQSQDSELGGRTRFRSKRVDLSSFLYSRCMPVHSRKLSSRVLTLDQ